MPCIAFPLTVPSNATARRDPVTWPKLIFEPVTVPLTVPFVTQLGLIWIEPWIVEPLCVNVTVKFPDVEAYFWLAYVPCHPPANDGPVLAGVVASVVAGVDAGADAAAEVELAGAEDAAPVVETGADAVAP